MKGGISSRRMGEGIPYQILIQAENEFRFCGFWNFNSCASLFLCGFLGRMDVWRNVLGTIFHPEFRHPPTYSSESFVPFLAPHNNDIYPAFLATAPEVFLPILFHLAETGNCLLNQPSSHYSLQAEGKVEEGEEMRVRKGLLI